MDTKASSSSSKVYRPVGLWRMIPLMILAGGVAFCLMFVILVFALSAMDTASRVVLIIGALIMLLLGVLLSFGFRGTRLVTSPEGVAYYGVGFCVYTPWDNIKGIGKGVYQGNHAVGTRFYQPDRRVQGLLLRRPAVVGATLSDGIQRHVPTIEATFALLAVANMSRFAEVIPTATFFNATAFEGFLTDARQYAPDVFDAQ